MRSRWGAFLLILPLVSGCLTRDVIDRATAEHPLFLNDRIDLIERAVITPDTNLVVLVEGKMARTPPGQFTIIANLAATREVEEQQVPQVILRNSVVAGWPSEYLVRTDLVAVAVAPLVIRSSELENLSGLSGVERTLYVVKTPTDHMNLRLVYVESNPSPRKICFFVQDEYAGSGHNYPMLFWLPITFSADLIVTPLAPALMTIMSATGGEL